MANTLVHQFVYEGRICLIRKTDFRSPFSSPFHCGYVEATHDVGYDAYMGIECEEPTFSGEFDSIKGKFFIGFDSGHCDDTPKTQSLEAVTKRTKKFAKELISLEKRGLIKLD